jgi:hypothetical protein
VPLQELSSLKLFRVWVRKSFELKDDCTFILLDRSLEAKDEDDAGLIDSDTKLLSAKDIEIVEVSPGIPPYFYPFQHSLTTLQMMNE